ncbi:hypothetical protein niasHT_034061 [Heterodera trifolii]|uniref:C2H2-type domain-containing protein n=1 Tax=Heterodera trifolii TaxID=157864 RepID=A0ABD2I3E0_9BILA
MLHQFLSSPSAANEMNGTFWEDGTEKGGDGQLRSAEECRNNGETIVVEEGEEKREFFLLTRMPPPPAASPPFFCVPSADFFAFDPSFSDCHPFGFSSSPLFPPFVPQNRPNFLHQNSPLSTDDGTTSKKCLESVDEETNQCERDDEKNEKLSQSEDEENANEMGEKEKSLSICSAGPILCHPSAERSLSPQPLTNPICPFCNRSFPRLKGDIRRHISQCQRLNKIANSVNDAATNFDQQNNGGICLSPASVDPSNPYQCRWCQFVTLYKGNMKRHLVTCHQVSVSLLNRIHFDVERLRKLSEQRPNLNELPIRPRRDGRDDGWTEEKDKGEAEGKGNETDQKD